MISATIIKDSTNWLGNRLTTFILEYPRLIHADFMTHRAFSKNAAGSRAIPVEKIIQGIITNTVYPLWTKDMKGMQSELITDENLIKELDADVYFMRDWIIGEVNNLKMKGVHKQNANRYLEPFQHIKLICTGTDWNNFFELRDHPMAQPEIQELARAIKKAMSESTPVYLQPGEWHIPFDDKIDDGKIWEKGFEKTKWFPSMKTLNELEVKISVARCARISYNNFDTNNIDIDKDLDLYDRLIVQRPIHASPCEHQARVPTESELEFFESRYITSELGHPKYMRGKYISNLNGWIQYRKIIEDETHR